MDADKSLNLEAAQVDYLFLLEDGAAYSLTNWRTSFDATDFAVLCLTDPPPFETVPFEVGSVGMRDNFYRTHTLTTAYDSGKDYNADNTPPFTLAGEKDGAYISTNFTLGEDWSITCQAFCGENLSGDGSVPFTINFTMLA